MSKLDYLRQGQTLHIIHTSFQNGALKNPKLVLTSIFIHSQKIPLPDLGYVIEKYPVNYIRRKIRHHGKVGIYLSRRKALTAYKKAILHG